MNDTPPTSYAANADPCCSNATNDEICPTHALQGPTNDLHNIDISSESYFDDMTTHTQNANETMCNMSCEKCCVSKGRNKKFYHARALEWIRMEKKSTLKMKKHA